MLSDGQMPFCFSLYRELFSVPGIGESQFQAYPPSLVFRGVSGVIKKPKLGVSGLTWRLPQLVWGWVCSELRLSCVSHAHLWAVAPNKQALIHEQGQPHTNLSWSFCKWRKYIAA